MSNEAARRVTSRSSSAGAVQTSPYQTTKTGLIGEQRDSMLQSELQILVSRSSNRHGEWHRSPISPVGVREISSTWPQVTAVGFHLWYYGAQTRWGCCWRSSKIGEVFLQLNLTFLALFYPPEPERAVNPDFEFVRDYAALNKASLEAGLTTAKGQSNFR